MRIAILIFDGVDLLDVGGPYEVFLTASRLREREGAEPPFEVRTVSANGAAVRAYGGLGLDPHCEAGDVGPLDVLIVPGAIDIDAVADDEEVVTTIRTLAQAATTSASVCTGAFLLARAGVLGSAQRWTTHWEDIDALAARLGDSGATQDVRWVDDGPVTTAGGLSSGIAMALHLVDRFAGQELAVQTARQLDYDWIPEP